MIRAVLDTALRRAESRVWNRVSEPVPGRNHLELRSKSRYDHGMISETIPQLRELSPEEKLTLSDELWREVTGEEPGMPDPDLVEELNQRFAEYDQNPQLGISASEMKQRFQRNG